MPYIPYYTATQWKAILLPLGNVPPQTMLAVDILGALENSSGGGASAVIITSADFSGSDYTNALLSGLTADEDFFLFSNDGSGTLLKVNDGYTFSGTTITTTAGNYRLLILTTA